MLIRVGQGYDIHRLVEGRPLILGGVRIDYDKGLQGHSDADALLHAMTDAVLGALALGDIGQHFPDNDQRFHRADSRIFLQEAVSMARTLGWHIINVDSTVIAQMPKLAPYTRAMRETIALDLGIDVAAVNVKAKTNEKLGYLGRGEAIEAQAVCLLAKPTAST